MSQKHNPHSDKLNHRLAGLTATEFKLSNLKKLSAPIEVSK